MRTLSPGLTIVRFPRLSSSYDARNAAETIRSFGCGAP